MKFLKAANSLQPGACTSCAPGFKPKVLKSLKLQTVRGVSQKTKIVTFQMSYKFYNTHNFAWFCSRFLSPGELWMLLDDFIEGGEDRGDGVIAGPNVPLRISAWQFLYQVPHRVFPCKNKCQLNLCITYFPAAQMSLACRHRRKTIQRHKKSNVS